MSVNFRKNVPSQTWFCGQANRHQRNGVIMWLTCGALDHSLSTMSTHKWMHCSRILRNLASPKPTGLKKLLVLCTQRRHSVPARNFWIWFVLGSHSNVTCYWSHRYWFALIFIDFHWFSSIFTGFPYKSQRKPMENQWNPLEITGNQWKTKQIDSDDFNST